MGLVRIPTERFEHVEFRVEAMRVDGQHPESRPRAGRARQRGRHLEIAIGLDEAILRRDHSR